MFRFIRLACVFLFLFVFGEVASAQRPLVVGSNGQLISFDTLNINLFIKMKTEKCGPYLTFVAPANSPNKVGVLIFGFGFIDSLGQKRLEIPVLGSEQVLFRRSDTQKVPKARVIKSSGPGHWVEIIISPEDLKQAPCHTQSFLVLDKPVG